jgi:hypothetical protein
LNIYTVIYGWRLAFVPLEPVEAMLIPVVADSVVAGVPPAGAAAGVSERPPTTPP